MPAAERARARLRRDREGDLRLRIDAPFFDDPPPAATAGAVPGLWNFEVVELFIARSDSKPADYLEIELGPHGHHWVLRLEGVRQPVAEGLPIDFTSTIDRAAGRWSGSARVPARHLPPPPHRLAFCAIHAAPAGGGGSGRRYWLSVRLPGSGVSDGGIRGGAVPGGGISGGGVGPPDFHQPEHFPRVG